MAVVDSGVRVVSSSTASSQGPSTAMRTPKSVTWCYEPSPPKRRADANSQSPGGDMSAIEARAAQLSRMSQLMRALSGDGA
ncbi:MAG TPA: hypothetical protein VK989_08400 [Polyangia bacterium]|nr:hypothetical protein [Polyangia bacterium]